MKIALIGYGKMGHEIEKIALERGHEIGLIIDLNNQADLTAEKLEGHDVAIEFTSPVSAINNYTQCIEAHIPVVSGTTGWSKQKEKIMVLLQQYDGTFFYASNFSLGVNLFFELNKQLARLMDPFEDYEISIEETHHIQKLDAPSGTAITLAEGIIDNLNRKKKWTLSNQRTSDALVINPIRRGSVPGIHTIRYESSADLITIQHEAKSRRGFAMGAVIAAEFTYGKKGWLGMNDLLSSK